MLTMLYLVRHVSAKTESHHRQSQPNKISQHGRHNRDCCQVSVRSTAAERHIRNENMAEHTSLC